jgi:hypothetical protein
LKYYWETTGSLPFERELPHLRLSRDEAAGGLKNEENSSWITKQLKKALDHKDREAVEVYPPCVPTS